ncbi:MAG: ABC transporter ATP-binding protein [Nocardioidaceae bacterium]|nr:ABC transporter ATP-binding protein [Nocardioidaceae bacterium]
MPEPILRAAGLTKTYGRTTVVDDVSFVLEAGESLGIVGESGSGKTTVARMIVGLETITAGTVEACGSDRTRPARSARERRRRGRDVQMVFQDPYQSLDPRQTAGAAIAEVLRHHAETRTADVARQVRELADLVGLDERQVGSRPENLSGGQRQRVAIARALAADPQVLILDESVAALDVSIQAQVLNTLADVREQTGVSYLFISHDLAVVRQVTDRVVVMKDGTIVESGATAEILDSPSHPYTQLLRASVPRPGWKPRHRTRREPTREPGASHS